jgi:D-sedoheptulose 7-phosphate isomerase
MDEITVMSKTYSSISEFANAYIQRLTSAIETVRPESLERFASELQDARRSGATVFLAGNGGSAATASTMANDLGSDLFRKRSDEAPLRVLSLTDNASVLTAVANDTGYQNVFLQQVKIHFRPGDKLIVISASGNSPNVVAIARWVKAQNGMVLGLVGFDGGELLGLCDVAIHVKTDAGEYGPVEDSHLVMNHILANWLQQADFDEN